MSFLSKVWAAIRTPTARLVGRDLNGNKFYEKYAEELGRTRRTVEYKNPEDMWNHQRRIPIQWSSWLSHTRPHPPTIEELQGDVERQARVRYNASLIEAKDREESETMKRLQAETHAQLVGLPGSAPGAATTETAATVESAAPSQSPSGQPERATKEGNAPTSNTPNPWDAAKNELETGSWAPQARRRGS